jgi:hypothetical protein
LPLLRFSEENPDGSVVIEDEEDSTPAQLSLPIIFSACPFIVPSADVSFSSCFQGSLASRIAEWNLLDFTVRHIRKCLGKEAPSGDTEMKQVD